MPFIYYCQLFVGSLLGSGFLSLHVCQTGIPNIAEFQFEINIDERAIKSSQMCDVRWEGLPHCSFQERPCLYNATSDPMGNYSFRCPLNTTRLNYISSSQITIGQVDDLPPCGKK